MKIGTLGPQYSFSHIMAYKISEDIDFYKRIEDVFEAVADSKIEAGIVPIENLLHGSVRETISSLRKYKLKINKAYNLEIHQHLASLTADYTQILSHPQAIGQCASFLKSVSVDILETTSTSKAMQLAAQDKRIAALGSEIAAKKFGLTILKRNVEDNHNNLTKFVLISKNENVKFNNENVKTSMLVEPHEDRPGLLFEILSVFEIKKINLSKIESMPSQKKLGEYFFYFEVEGNLLDKNLKDALAFLRTFVDVYSYGSYECI